MTKAQFFKAALLGVVLTASGCAVNETATVTTNSAGEQSGVLVSNSGFLSANLSIADTKIGKAGDLMRVQATIENKSRNDASFQYKFKWMDKDGFEVSVGGRPWQPLTITAYESKAVQAVAPNPSATTFQILVQD